GENTAPLDLSFSVRKRIVTLDSSFHSDDALLNEELQRAAGVSVMGEAAASDSIPRMNILVNDNPTDGYIYFAGHHPSFYAGILDKDGNILRLIQDASSY